MSNKYAPHVVLIPEDHANEQLANGFALHHGVRDRLIEIRNPAGGWGHVLDVFTKEIIPYLKSCRSAHAVLLVDFDESDERGAICEGRIPAELKDRVFVIGSWATPEDAKRDFKMGLEAIGQALAEECSREKEGLWASRHFGHNAEVLERLAAIVKPILFGP
ncbi:MAG: hypothetical protein K2W96_21575 [Gemmataceae bacterium]|nr:hypothetical protein [Gemmataceae bacterium]